jgi:hypothetical protein
MDNQGLMHRIVPRHGSIIRFTFDGEILTGHSGETILTAILCERPALRQSEFLTEMRAGFCLMAACQDCWIWTRDGLRLRACSTPLSHDLDLLSTPPMMGET